MAEEEAKIQIRIDPERIKDGVTLDEFIDMQEGSMKATRDVIGRFVWKDGAYLSPEEGAKVVGGQTFRQLEELVQAFKEGVSGTIVPPERGGTST